MKRGEIRWYRFKHPDKFTPIRFSNVILSQPLRAVPEQYKKLNGMSPQSPPPKREFLFG